MLHLKLELGSIRIYCSDIGLDLQHCLGGCDPYQLQYPLVMSEHICHYEALIHLSIWERRGAEFPSREEQRGAVPIYLLAMMVKLEGRGWDEK